MLHVTEKLPLPEDHCAPAPPALKGPPRLPVLSSPVSPSPSFFFFLICLESLFPISCQLAISNNSRMVPKASP